MQPWLNLSVLGFSFVVFYDKAKRTQQEDLLGFDQTTITCGFCPAGAKLSAVTKLSTGLSLPRSSWPCTIIKCSGVSEDFCAKLAASIIRDGNVDLGNIYMHAWYLEAEQSGFRKFLAQYTEYIDKKCACFWFFWESFPSEPIFLFSSAT